MGISLFVWIFDRLTGMVSSTIGIFICGDAYMCPVDGVVCDLSCGFNTDLHLSFAMVLFFIFGLMFYVSSKKSLPLKETKSMKSNKSVE